MSTSRIKIYDDQGNNYSLKNFKKIVKEDSLKDMIPQALIIKQKLLTLLQIEKLIIEKRLNRVDFKGQIFFKKEEVAKCLNLNGINLKLK